MERKQTNQQPPLPRPVASWKIASRHFGLFAVVLVLYGCSTPQVQHPAQVPEQNVTRDNAKDIETHPVTDEDSNRRDESKAESNEETAPSVPEDNKVYFASGSVVIGDEEKGKLKQHADRLKRNPKIYVTLSGHTDDLGSRNYNLAIAEERLIAVNKLLQRYGAPPRQIRRNRSSSAKNLPACTTTDCRRQRRRVDLVYSP